jgi:phage-related minor tail protein
LNKALERRNEIERRGEEAKGAARDAQKTDRDRLEDAIKAIQGQINTLMDPVNQLIALSESLGNSFAESFKGIVTGSMSAQQALANLFQRTADHFLDMAAQMIAAQIRMQAVKLFMSFFPDLGGGGGGGGSNGSGFVIPPDNLTPAANGNAFGRNGLIPFAKGGVVNKPTLFPFANGTGLMGEAGPEAILPLSRGPNGRLGVEALGGGAGATNIVVNVDASGSSVEGESEQAAQLGKMLGAAIQAELVKQKRPGGLLAT